MRQSRVLQALQVALALVCAATLAYYATGVDKSHSLLGAALIFAFSAGLALSPYVLLWHLLRFEPRVWLKSLAFVLTVAPAPILFFVIWRHDSEGWSFFLVPLVQVPIALAFLLAAARLKHHASAGVPT